MKKFQDLSDEQLRNLDLLDTRKAYVGLREHHIDETIKLYAKVKALTEENQRLKKAAETAIVQELIKSYVMPQIPDSDELGKKLGLGKYARSNSSGTDFKCDLTRQTCPGCPVHD